MGWTREVDVDGERFYMILTVCSMRRLVSPMPSERVARRKRNALMESCVRDAERSEAVGEKMDELAFVRLRLGEREDAEEDGGWV